MSFFTKAIPSFFKSAGNGIVTAAKAVGNGVVTAAKAVAKSVSKDGALTNAVQNYVPAGGLVTAAVHAAAGNRDYAEYAAVKGLSTTVTTALTAVGSLAGPGGAALMAGAGAVAGNLIEGGFKGVMRDTVKNKLDDLTLAGVGTSFAVGAGFALLGPAGKALKGSSVGKALKGSGAGKAVSDMASKAAKSAAAPFVKVGNKVSGGFSKVSTWVSPPKLAGARGLRPDPGFRIFSPGIPTGRVTGMPSRTKSMVAPKPP